MCAARKTRIATSLRAAKNVIGENNFLRRWMKRVAVADGRGRSSFFFILVDCRALFDVRRLRQRAALQSDTDWLQTLFYPLISASLSARQPPP